jgi:uncharacterized protein
MNEDRKIRDPIHDFIELNGKESNIINSSPFQRLRGIKQLAMANLVYPGALHTRFEHSIAVCHVANSMANNLGISESNREIVKLAGLLHDIGHGPFSHVSENVLELYADQGANVATGGNREKIHELVTANIIRFNRELVNFIGQHMCDNIADLLAYGYDDPILKSIVSGPLDADKQDYLLRDSYYCGVKYGIFDINQLHRELRSVMDPSTGLYQLMVSEDGVHAVEQFILAKYHISNQVYRHRVRLITDQMITRAIRLGIEFDNINELQTLYYYDGSPEYINNYLKWDDARIFNLLDNPGVPDGSYFKKIFLNLKNRKLHKRIFTKKVIELNEDCRDLISKITKPSLIKRRDEIEKAISDLIKEILGIVMDPKEIILYSFNINSVRSERDDDEESILVNKRLHPVPFEGESVLFRSINPTVTDFFVEIYAPIIYNTPAEREGILSSLNDPIVSLLGNYH